jgi:hypothetical protein
MHHESDIKWVLSCKQDEVREIYINLITLKFCRRIKKKSFTSDKKSV